MNDEEKEFMTKFKKKLGHFFKKNY